jgi:hypothetical protein
MQSSESDKKSAEQVLIRFLERTKNGDFAPINENDLLYVRLNEVDNYNHYLEDDYNYNIH